MRSKALLLLFIFLLNTATGFACALRMSAHEQEEAAGYHEADPAAEHHHEGHHSTVQLSNQQYSNGIYIIANDDLCCQGAVNSFNSLAKVAPQSNHIVLLAPFTYVAAYHLFLLNPVSGVQAGKLIALNKRLRPPTYPIRIAIQSFQI